MLALFLIGLREGLEASLVIGIIVAYLVKTGRRDSVRYVWVGLLAAIAISVAFSTFLQYSTTYVPQDRQELLGGILSILAVGFVTWMIFWMRKASRGIKRELEGKVDSAISMGPLALVLMALLAVGREGLETSVFVWSTTTMSDNSAGTSTMAAIAGLVVAALLGYLMYRGALRINLGRFFSVTGGALIVVAAGVFAYGWHDLQEYSDFQVDGFFPRIADNLAFDVSSTIAPDGVLGTFLKGTVGFMPQMTWIDVAAWALYLVPMLVLFYRPSRTPAAPTSAPTTASTPAEPAPAARA